jgi:hypothetical protein
MRVIVSILCAVAMTLSAQAFSCPSRASLLHTIEAHPVVVEATVADRDRTIIFHRNRNGDPLIFWPREVWVTKLSVRKVIKGQQLSTIVLRSTDSVLDHSLRFYEPGFHGIFFLSTHEDGFWLQACSPVVEVEEYYKIISALENVPLCPVGDNGVRGGAWGVVNDTDEIPPPWTCRPRSGE